MIYLIFIVTIILIIWGIVFNFKLNRNAKIKIADWAKNSGYTITYLKRRYIFLPLKCGHRESVVFDIKVSDKLKFEEQTGYLCCRRSVYGTKIDDYVKAYWEQ